MPGSGHTNEFRGAAGSFVQARDVFGGVHLHSPPTARPRQLPPPVADFTGREPQLAELDDLLDRTATGVVISAVSGTAGVGKTALAVHWAHRVRERFPDGQLYADLRGYDREQPLPPEDVLAGFLRALGDTEVPDDVAERAARYRGLVADRRVLVVLDNARTAEQVRPLLPGGTSCFVVVTSRDRLPGLRVRYGARGVDLDLLSLDEALRLLRATVGARVDGEPGAAAALVRLCARLPLALRITAEVAVDRQRASLREIADELTEEWRILGVAEDDRTIRTVFSWSVRHLDDDCRAVFRLLGLHPGRDYDAAAVAALAGVDEHAARRALDGLVRAHLVEENADRRYRMHDLLTAYARELAEEDFGAESAEARRRLFRHYADTAAKARQRGPDGLAWFEAERLTLELVAQAGPLELWPTPFGDFTHNLAVLHSLAGDVPRSLRYFQRARGAVAHLPAEHDDRITLDQVETLLAAGLHSEATHLLDELGERGSRPDDPELDRLRSVAALAQGDLKAAALLARSARATHLRRGELRQAATCGLTYLAATTAVPTHSSGERVGTALTIAAELDEVGLGDEVPFALLTGARLLIIGGDLDQGVELLDEADRVSRETGGDPPIEHVLLRHLCRGELALGRDDPAGVLAQVAQAFTAVEQHGTPALRLTPVPISTFYFRSLRNLALHVAMRRPDTRALFDFTERARVQHPRYRPHPVPVESEVVTVDAVDRALGRRALVNCTRLWGELYALVNVDGELHTVKVCGTGAALSSALRLRADIGVATQDQLPDELRESALGSAKRHADQLDQLVVRPLLPHIGDRDLVIVPTGALYSVAWAALPSLRGRALEIAPSVTSWLTAETSRSTEPVGQRRAVFALGPGTTLPLQQLTAPAGYHPRSEVIVTQRATVANVLAASDGAGLVHIAAHGRNEADHSSFSRLELTDGPLFAHQFSELRRPPGQVILTACELALSSFVSDEEALGFAGGLLNAGVSTVIASVGRTGDRAAAATMHDYHRALGAGHSPARALALAVAVDPLRRPFICIGSGKA